MTTTGVYGLLGFTFRQIKLAWGYSHVLGPRVGAGKRILGEFAGLACWRPAWRTLNGLGS